MINAPSSRTRYVIAVCILCVFGTISVSIYKNRPTSKNTSDSETPIVNEIELELQATGGNEDSDLDGLKAWEEALWGTSDTLSDTDGDGTPDGEEVTIGRNPIVSGDDLIATTTPIDSYTPQNTDPNSLTSRIARSIFENVAQMPTDESYTREVGDAVAQQIAAAALAASSEQVIFTLEDVQMNTKPTKEDIHQYGNILMTNILENMRDVYLDPAATEDLGIAARGFRDTADDLARMIVPAQIAGTHSKIVNNYYNIYESLQHVYYYKDDPAQALLALRNYSEIAQEQPRQFSVIEDYLRSNGIIYNADELGGVAFPNLIGFQQSTQ